VNKLLYLCGKGEVVPVLNCWRLMRKWRYGSTHS